MIVNCPHMLRGQFLETKKIFWSGYVMYKLRLLTFFSIVQPTKTVSPAGQNCDNAVYFPVTVIGWHWVINNLGMCLQSAAPTFLLNSSLRCYSYILSIMSAYFSATAFLFTLSVGPRRLSKGFIIWWALWKMNNNSADQYRSIIDQNTDVPHYPTMIPLLPNSIPILCHFIIIHFMFWGSQCGCYKQVKELNQIKVCEFFCVTDIPQSPDKTYLIRHLLRWNRLVELWTFVLEWNPSDV